MSRNIASSTDKMKNSIRSSGLGWITGFILIISCFLYFRYATIYHICFKEQIQLFVYSWSYLFTYFSKPAAFACLGGDFFTQFLYFKGGGAAIVTFLLAVEWLFIFWVLKRFSVRGYALFWSLLPVIADWILFSQISFSLSLSV